MTDDVLDLAEYFPGRLPALVADLWAVVLEDAYECTVECVDGRLWARGTWELRDSMVAPLSSPEEAAEYWRAKVQPELRAHSEAVTKVVVDQKNLVAALEAFRSAWKEFFAWYFANPAAGWIDDAKAAAASDARIKGRSTMVRRRQRCLEDLARATTGQSGASTDGGAYEKLLDIYVREFGAYSRCPQNFSEPYPRDDPGLVGPEVDLVVRGILRHGVLPSHPVHEANGKLQGVMSLVGIAEDDNYYQYEACFGARRVCLKIAGCLVELGILGGVSEVWELSLSELERMVRDDPGARAVATRVDSPVEMARSDREGSVVLHGNAVVPGTASGHVWRFSTGTMPPDDVTILVVDGLGNTYAGSVLPYSMGLIARHGTTTSHCALIAREVGCPVVVLGDAIDELDDGDWVTVEADGTVLVSLRSTVSDDRSPDRSW